MMACKMVSQIWHINGSSSQHNVLKSTKNVSFKWFRENDTFNLIFKYCAKIFFISVWELAVVNTFLFCCQLIFELFMRFAWGFFMMIIEQCKTFHFWAGDSRLWFHFRFWPRKCSFRSEWMQEGAELRKAKAQELIV